MGQQSSATKSSCPHLEQGQRSALSRLRAQLALAVVFSSALGGCSGDARSETPAPVAAIEPNDGSAAPVAPPVAPPPAPAPRSARPKALPPDLARSGASARRPAPPSAHQRDASPATPADG